MSTCIGIKTTEGVHLPVDVVMATLVSEYHFPPPVLLRLVQFDFV